MLNRKAKAHRRRIIYIVGFILATSSAFISYIQSNFLGEHIKVELISLFFVLANFLSVLSMIFFHKVLERLGNYVTGKSILIIYTASLLSLAAASGPISATLSLILFILASNLVWISIDIFLEEISTDKKTGRIRTTYLTINNLGWILGPMISANLVEVGSYSLSFLGSAALSIPIILIFISQKKNLNSKVKKSNKKILKSLSNLWKNKNLRGVFIAAIALNVFFSAAVLYIPLYLHQSLHMSWAQLGWVFSFMLLPFIIFEIPVGLTADKYLGEKEMMFLGLFIIFSALFLFYYIDSPSILLWALVLFFSRIGAAMVEATRDTYFFKNVDSSDLGLIDLFRMTGPLGYLIGAAVGSLILVFLPINSIFLIMAILIIPAFYSIALIEDTK